MATAETLELEQSVEELNCGFCLQKLMYMEDPRRLPCDHVFCLPCLEGDFAKYNTVQCGFCGMDHGQIRITGLPCTTVTVQPTLEVTVLSGDLTCDMCSDLPGKMLKYCVDCDKKLCIEHLQFHNKLVGVAHSLLDKKEYGKAEKKNRIKRICPDHKKEMRLACKHCHIPFCEDCLNVKLSFFCSSNKGGQHYPILVSTLAQEYRNKTAIMLKQLSMKIRDIAQSEKKGWKNLDDVEQYVTNLKTEVDQAREKQIEEIRQASDELKEQISKYLENSTKQIESSVAGMMLQREDLEATWQQLTKKCLYDSDSQSINDFGGTMKSIDTALQSLEHENSKLDGCSLVNTAQDPGFRIQFICWNNTRPLKLKCLHKDDKPGYFSICWTRQDSLVTCGDREITILSDKLETLSKSESGVDILRPGSNSFIAIVSSEKRSDLMLVSYNLKFRNQIDTLAQYDDSVKFSYNLLAVAESKMFALDRESMLLKVYSITDYCMLYTREIYCTGKPYIIHAISENLILFSDDMNESVHAFQLEPELELLWSCKLTAITSISHDEFGFIYVGTVGGHMVYILSNKGEHIHTLHSEETWGDIVDMSIKGDRLAIVTPTHRAVFKMKNGGEEDIEETSDKLDYGMRG